MEAYNKWKHSPATGERLYTTSEIAEYYGLSAQELNKFLVKFDFLFPKDQEHDYYRIKNKAHGTILYFNPKTYTYELVPSDDTSNITPKFNDLGKAKIENLLNKLNLISSCDINDDYDELEHFFPEGDFALSIRRSGTKFNPKDGPTKIYISNRFNRDGSHLNRDYLFIPNEDATAIGKEITQWRKAHRLPVNNWAMNLDNSETATHIIIWKDKFFFDILNKAGYTIKLSNEQIKNNKQLINNAINN